MNKKPFSPAVHGLNDYLFSGILFCIPSLLGLNRKARRFYNDRALNVLVYNALTDHPLGVKKAISYKTHHKIDILNVAMLAVSSFYKPVRKDKQALAFHLGITALAVMNVMLTNWDADKKANRAATIRSEQDVPIPQPGS